MQFTDAEIKRIARQRSDGCSTRYNQIKKELETYNESVTTADTRGEETPEPPSMRDRMHDPVPDWAGDLEVDRFPSMISREVRFVRRAYGLTFFILFFLMIVWTIWATVTGV